MSIVLESPCRRDRNSDPLEFEPVRLTDLDQMRRLVQSARLYGNDVNYANLFLLQRKHRITICFRGGFLFRRYDGPYRQGYGFPVGSGDWNEALQAIEQDAQDFRRPLDFCLLTENQKTILEYYRPRQRQYQTDRGDSDYVYSRDDLANLPGRKYQRKRNAIHRFINDYPDWRFEPLSVDAPSPLFDDVRSIVNAWFDFHEGAADPSLRSEFDAIRTALFYFKELNLTGGVLYAGRQPAAFSLASPTLDNVYDIHFEKAIPEIPQAYAMICHATAQFLTSARLINREEDVNEPGLRKA